MIKPGFYLLLLVTTIIACTSPTKVVYRLTDDELAHLMLDMHLADVILHELPKGQRDSIQAIYWVKMKEVYKLSEEEIRDEIAKLETEPEKLKLILGHVKQVADSL